MNFYLDSLFFFGCNQKYFKMFKNQSTYIRVTYSECKKYSYAQ